MPATGLACPSCEGYGPVSDDATECCATCGGSGRALCVACGDAHAERVIGGRAVCMACMWMRCACGAIPEPYRAHCATCVREMEERAAPVFARIAQGSR